MITADSLLRYHPINELGVVRATIQHRLGVNLGDNKRITS